MIGQNYPSFTLNAVSRDKLSTETVVFNINQFQYYLHVHIPDDMNRFFICYQVKSGDKKYEPTDELENKILYEHDRNHPWYKFTFDTLDKSEGLHIYQMDMVHRYTNDTYPLYFGYIVQNDFPERNYDYMKKYR